MQLFYHPDILKTSEDIPFSKEESRHIVRVLRKKEGDTLHITDGKGNLYISEIIHANDKRCLVRVISVEAKPKHWNYHLHIAIAPTKLNDRMEWFLEKATEIGIDEITPVICEHSERRHIKSERMEKVILSAMKQSLKCDLPVFNEPIKFKDFVGKKNWDLGLIAHCEEGQKKQLGSFLPFHKKLMILIGPEGDFSAQEIELALKNELKPIGLGESRLRTETAGIVACNTVSILNEPQ